MQQLTRLSAHSKPAAHDCRELWGCPSISAAMSPPTCKDETGVTRLPHRRCRHLASRRAMLALEAHPRATRRQRSSRSVHTARAVGQRRRLHRDRQLQASRLLRGQVAGTSLDLFATDARSKCRASLFSGQTLREYCRTGPLRTSAVHHMQRRVVNVSEDGARASELARSCRSSHLGKEPLG